MPTDELPIEQLFPNPNQPRKTFEAGPLQELSNSISQLGLMQPITVAPDPTGKADSYMIVAGERRWRASQMAGLTKVPVTIREIDANAIADLALMENLLREDLNEIEEARGYKERIDAGYTLPELVKMLGYKSDGRVVERLALLKLHPEFQEALTLKYINASQARQMAYLSYEGQRRVFDAIRSGRASSMALVRRMTVAIYDTENQQNLFKSAEDLTEVEKRSLTRVDKFVDGADRLLSMLTDEDFHLIRLTLKSDAPRCIEKLGLLISVAGKLKLAMETSVAKFEESQESQRSAA